MTRFCTAWNATCSIEAPTWVQGFETVKKKTTKNAIRLVLVALAVLFGAIQLVPVDRENPPVGMDIPSSNEVKSILRRACYDCHSNETDWPWYGHVAPLSWLVADDVEEGREELNFSTWNSYNAEKIRKKIGEIWEEVEEGEMPPWSYLLTHGEARLSEQDRRLLHDWAALETGFVEHRDANGGDSGSDQGSR